MVSYFRQYYWLCLLVLISIYGCKTDDDSLQIRAGRIDFVKTFGGSKNDSGQSVIATNDGGYAILGFTQSNDGDITDSQNQNYKYWVLKFSNQDVLEWSKTYGGTLDDRGQSIIQTSDGGYALLGSSTSNDGDVSNNSGSVDLWLAKLNVSGDIVWQNSFGFLGIDSGTSIIETADGGYLLTGVLDVTASGGAGNSNRMTSRHAGGDYWVLKLSALGAMEWSRYYGGNFTDTPEGVVQLNDGGYMIVGGSDSDDTDISSNIGSYDFWVIRISATGELVWEKSFGGEEIDEARAIVATSDGNFLIAGDTRSDSNDVSLNRGSADMWVLKIDGSGNILWENTFGGTNFDVARATIKSQDNGFILAGSSRSDNGDVSQNKGQNDAWVVKIDSNGSLVWETSFGGSNIDFAYGIAERNDGTIIVVGDTTSNDGDISNNQGFTDLFVCKLKQ